MQGEYKKVTEDVVVHLGYLERQIVFHERETEDGENEKYFLKVVVSDYSAKDFISYHLSFEECRLIGVKVDGSSEERHNSYKELNKIFSLLTSIAVRSRNIGYVDGHVFGTKDEKERMRKVLGL